MPDNTSSIIVCDQLYDVGRPVVTFRDDPSIDAHTLHCVSKPDIIYPWSPAKGLGQVAYRYRERRVMGTDRSLSRLQQVIRQFVIHHDGMGTSRDCFRVLHDERGLSVHFLIDNDGTIFQTLDLLDCGFQAGGVNELSVGVELCSRGDKTEPGTYPGELYQKFPRQPVTCTINSHQWLAWSYTQEQYESMSALARSLARIFPGLPQACPVDGGGEPIWGTLSDNLEIVRSFSGYLGHYHITNQKWDPGPWDFKKFIQSIKGRMFFPALPGKPNVEIPDEAEEAVKTAGTLYDNNEKEGDGGYFPVGPLGETRMWHTGIHLRDDRGKPIASPFAGKIVAARMKKDDDWPEIGSSNFVLIRHEMAAAGAALKFYSLYFHVDSEKDEEKMPSWMKNGRAKGWWGNLESGRVTLLDEAVGAGEPIAHFGEAGPPGARAGQVHFSVFSDEEIGAKVEPGFWTLIEGGKSRFCEQYPVIAAMDLNKNYTLQHQEVQWFFQNSPVREYLRKYVVHVVSEWGDNDDFWNALNTSFDFRGWPEAKRRKAYDDQIASMFFWNDELSKHTGLPDDKVVYHYHPITFVLWLHQKTKGQAQTSKTIQDAAAFQGKKPPSEIKDDTSEGAEGFMDDEDALFGEAAKKLDLEKLAEGYPDQ